MHTQTYKPTHSQTHTHTHTAAHKQSHAGILNLWAHSSSGSTFVLQNLAVDKPGTWLPRTLPGAPQVSRFLPHLCLWCCRPHTHSRQHPGRLEARSEACSALPLKPQQDYLFNSPKDSPARLNNNSLVIKQSQGPSVPPQGVQAIL